MDLLPTIIILALLAFFVVLTSTLLLWYWKRNRSLQQKNLGAASRANAPRKLTLRDGKAIPHDLVIEALSDRDRYSLDLQSPGIEKEFEYDVEKGFTKTTPPKSSKRTSRQSFRNTLAEKGQQWIPGKPPWLMDPPGHHSSPRDTGQKVTKPTRSKNRDRSRSIPRPSLINIERRGSGQTQRSSEPPPRKKPRQSTGRRASSQTQMTPEMQEKRRGMDITASLFNAYKGSTPWASEIHELPPSSVVMPGPAKTVASSTRSSSHRWSVPASVSVHSSVPPTASVVGSSRVVSDADPVRPPAPLFAKVDYQSPAVSFAPTQDVNRKSFLTITDSRTSSTSSEHAILGQKEPMPVMAEPPLTSLTPPTSAPAQIAPPKGSIFSTQLRPMKTMSVPAPNPPEVLERVRAFGRRHRDRPVSIGARTQKSPPLTHSLERPVSLAGRRQVSSELLRQLQRPRSNVQHDDGTSDLVQQLEETANMVQRQSIIAASMAHAKDGPTSMPRQLVEGDSRVSEQASAVPMLQERRRTARTASKRPPSIEVDIPHVERGSLSFFDSTPTPPRSGNILQRGPSVMSNRSGFTIASSEISSNWTIGKAELVNIYPSVADEDEDEYESLREAMQERARNGQSSRRTPPYAKVLRSKYGQYPKGTRDKALPTLPKSPLRHSMMSRG